MSVSGLTTPDLSAPSSTYSYTDNDAINVVHDFPYSPVTDDGGRWVKVLERINNVVTINAGSIVINGLFQQFGTGNIKYIVNGAAYNYYKRLTYKTTFDFYSNFAVTWSNQSSNTLNQDFKIYSTYSDLLATTNKWKFCSYNVLNVGYPGYCGPNSKTTSMWTGFTPTTPYSNTAPSTEIWIQVFSDSKIYTTDLIQNGDFEAVGSNFNNYGIPVSWTSTSTSNIATIRASDGKVPTLQGVSLIGEKGSLCGISHILMKKSVGLSSFPTIKQTVHIPSGIYTIISCNF